MRAPNFSTTNLQTESLERTLLILDWDLDLLQGNSRGGDGSETQTAYNLERRCIRLLAPDAGR